MTLLAGEKRLNVDFCTTDQQPDDNDGYARGCQDDVVRWGATGTPWGDSRPAPAIATGQPHNWDTIRPAIWQFGRSRMERSSMAAGSEDHVPAARPRQPGSLPPDAANADTRRPSRTAIGMASAAIVAACLTAGCSQGEVRSEKPMDPTAVRLLALGAAYSQFTFEKGRPPRGPEDLRGLLPAPDALTSPRDSEPFVVFWGVDLRGPQKWATGRPILAHERTGAGGSRFVLSTMRNVEQLDEAAFRASSFPPQRGEKR